MAPGLGRVPFVPSPRAKARTALAASTARKHFKNALQINSKHEDIHFNIAIVYEKMGLVNMAKRHWKEYLKIDPHSEWAELVKEHLGD